MKVELVPHVAQKFDPNFGMVKVEHNQYMVYLTAPLTKHRCHVGYVGKQPNAPINGTSDFTLLPQEAKQAVVDYIHATLGGTHKVSEPFIPPPRTQEADILDEEYDE